MNKLDVFNKFEITCFEEDVYIVDKSTFKVVLVINKEVIKENHEEIAYRIKNIWEEKDFDIKREMKLDLLLIIHSFFLKEE